MHRRPEFPRYGGAVTLPPKRRRKRTRARRIVAIAVLATFALGVSMLARPSPRLVWNASASAPLGLYWLAVGPVSRRDFVLAELPDSARRLAATRGYLPAGVPLVKRVAAISGDTVCAVGTTVAINGNAVAARLTGDSRGRPLPAWSGCRALHNGEFFLLMPDVPDSFDGRYFGPVAASSIIGRLVPLWTW